MLKRSINNIFCIFALFCLAFCTCKISFCNDITTNNETNINNKNAQGNTNVYQNTEDERQANKQRFINKTNAFEISNILTTNYSNTNEIKKTNQQLKSAKQIDIVTKADILPKPFFERSQQKNLKVESSQDAFFLGAKNINTTKYGIEWSFSDALYGYWQKIGYSINDRRSNQYNNIRISNEFVISLFEIYQKIIVSYVNYSSALTMKDIAESTFKKVSTKEKFGVESKINLLKSKITMDSSLNDANFYREMLEKNIAEYNKKAQTQLTFEDINLESVQNFDVLSVRPSIDKSKQFSDVVKEKSFEILEIKSKLMSSGNNAGYNLSTLFPNVNFIYQEQTAKYDSLTIKQNAVLANVSFKMFDNAKLASYIKARNNYKIEKFDYKIKENEIIDKAIECLNNMNYYLEKTKTLTKELELEEMVIELKSIQFESGEINVIDLLDEQKKLLDTKKNLAEVKLNYIINALKVKNYIGDKIQQY